MIITKPYEYHKCVPWLNIGGGGSRYGSLFTVTVNICIHFSEFMGVLTWAHGPVGRTRSGDG